MVRAAALGGYGIDAQWSDDFHHALHVVLTGERAGYYRDFGQLADLATALREAFVYPAGSSRRIADGATGAPPPAWREIASSATSRPRPGRQPADRRADRADLSPGPGAHRRRRCPTAPFVPMLFQGEEWGASTPFQYFTDFAAPELGSAVRTGRRREAEAFGWGDRDMPDPQDRGTFAASRLRWTEREQADHGEMLAWYRALIALRRATPSLRDPRLDHVEIACDASGGWMRMTRGEIATAFNLGVGSASVPLGEGRWQVELASGGVEVGRDEALVTLEPESVAVLRRRPEEQGHPRVER